MAAGKAGKDVRELGRELTQRRLGLRGRYASLLEIIGESGDLGARGIDPGGVLLERIGLDQAGVLVFGQLLLLIVQLLQCGQSGIDLAEQRLEPFGLYASGRCCLSGFLG